MIINSESLEYLKTLPENYIDSIVTDPPYGLKFMGKKWDYDVPSVELWKECLRVLKPGGHLLESRIGSIKPFNAPARNSGYEPVPIIKSNTAYKGEWVNGRFPANLIHDGSEEVVRPE